MKTDRIKSKLTVIIDRLPKQQQVVLSLCYVEQLSLPEIAWVMGLKPSEAYGLYLRSVVGILDHLE